MPDETNINQHAQNVDQQIGNVMGDVYIGADKPDFDFAPYVNDLRPYIRDLLDSRLNWVNAPLDLSFQETPDKTEQQHRTTVWIFGLQAHGDPDRVYDDFAEAFDEHQRHMLLLGEPGAGKTVTLLQQAQRHVEAWRVGQPVPFFGEIASWRPGETLPGWLARLIAERFRRHLDAKLIARTIEDKRALLLLDGLDELPSGYQERDKPDQPPRDLRQEFMAALHALPETFTLITCRVADYDDIQRRGGGKLLLRGAVTLRPLRPEDIQRYLLGFKPPLHDLWAYVADDADLLRLLSTPLLLTLLAIAQSQGKAKRPELRGLGEGDARDAILRSYVTFRYRHEEHRAQLRGETLPFTLEAVYEGLGAAWLRMLSDSWRSGSGFIELHSHDFVESTSSLPQFAQTLFLLLPIEGGRYRFPHLSIRDHFALPYCLKAMRDANASVQRQATRGLGRIGDVRAVPELLDALRDTDRELSWRAEDALDRIGDAWDKKRLLAALRDADPGVRQRAAWELGEIGDIWAVSRLLSVLRDTDAGVRQRAAWALGEIGQRHKKTAPAIAPWLQDALRDTDTGVCQAAATSLGEIGDTQAVSGLLEKLLEELHDTNTNVRGRAAGALGRIGKPAVPGLLDALHDADTDVVWRATWALGESGDTRAVLELLEVLRDGDEAVRREAAGALGKIGDARAVPGLLTALRDGDANMRVSVAHALRKLGYDPDNPPPVAEEPPPE